MFSVFGYSLTIEDFVLTWFLLVMAILGWVLIRGLLRLTRQVRQIDRRKLVADVSAVVSNAATSAEAAKSRYEPGISDGIASMRTRIAPHFAFTGRIARKQYLLTQVTTGLGLGVALVVAEGLLDSRHLLSQSFGILLVLMALGLVLWVVLAASAKRMRDTGVTDWWVLALLVPALNLAAYAFLFLVPTDEFEGRGL